MTPRDSGLRRLALWLGKKSGDLLPARDADWAKAISCEIQNISSDVEALRWSLGALRACLNERTRIMLARILRVSRWVWVPEMLLCFAPLTLGGLLFVADTWDVHASLGIQWWLVLAAAAVGPAGLAAAAWKAAHPHVPMNKSVVVALCVVAGGSLAVLIPVVLMGPGTANAPMLDRLRDSLLLGGLPFIGALHLAAIADPPELDEAAGV